MEQLLSLGKRVKVAMGQHNNQLRIITLIVLLVIVWLFALSQENQHTTDAYVGWILGKADSKILGICIYAPIGRESPIGLFDLITTTDTIIEDRRFSPAQITTADAIVPGQHIQLLAIQVSQDRKQVSAERVLIIADTVAITALPMCLNESPAP